jgi:hypothetical protein
VCLCGVCLCGVCVCVFVCVYVEGPSFVGCDAMPLDK